MMTDFLNAIGRIWPLAALLGLLGSAIWYVAGLDSRVQQLDRRMQQAESQVHTLTVAPLITQVAPERGNFSADKPPPADYSQPVIANPIAGACAKLADTLAEQVKTTAPKSYIDSTSDALRLLGCVSSVTATPMYSGYSVDSRPSEVPSTPTPPVVRRNPK